MASLKNTSITGTLSVSTDTTLTGDLTVNGGDITLGGTGRIQGIDTVSSGTDAVNKTYADTKAPKASPALTGTPTAPTAAAGTNTTQVATTAFVQANSGTNTWRGIQNNLTSTSTTDSLSAYQGKLLNDNKQGLLTAGSVCKTVTGDWNNVGTTGFFMGSELTNQCPGSSWRYCLVMAHNAAWVSQTMFDFNGTAAYQRNKVNGTWGSWRSMTGGAGFASVVKATTVSGCTTHNYSAGRWQYNYYDFKKSDGALSQRFHVDNTWLDNSGCYQCGGCG